MHHTLLRARAQLTSWRTALTERALRFLVKRREQYARFKQHPDRIIHLGRRHLHVTHLGATLKKLTHGIKLAVCDQTTRQESTIELSDITLRINFVILVVHIELNYDGLRCNLLQGAANLLLNRFLTHSARCEQPPRYAESGKVACVRPIVWRSTIPAHAQHR